MSFGLAMLTITVLLLSLYGMIYGLGVINGYWLFSKDGIAELFAHWWFVIVLFIYRVLFSSRFIYNNYKAISFVSFVISILLYHTVGFGKYYWCWVLPAIPFCGFGMLLKEIDWTPSKTNHYLYILYAFIFITVGYYNRNDICAMYGNAYEISYFLYYIVAISGCLCLYFLCSKLKSTIIVENVSQGTLFIYGINGALLSIILSFLLNHIHGVFVNFIFLLAPVMFMFVCSYSFIHYKCFGA